MVLAPVITLQNGSEAFPLLVISTSYIPLFPTFLHVCSHRYNYSQFLYIIFLKHQEYDCVKHLVNVLVKYGVIAVMIVLISLRP